MLNTKFLYLASRSPANYENVVKVLKPKQLASPESATRPFRCLVASLKRLLHLTRLPRQQPPLPLLLLPHQQHRQIRVARLTPIIRSGG